MESSAGCWAAYGEVLTREYSDPAYSEFHRLSVDAYAVQHPGRPSRQSIRSVGLHLIRLCLVLEGGLDLRRANEAMRAAASAEDAFVWLEPPASPGDVTVADIQKAANPREHKNAVRAWASSAWSAWAAHHETVRGWLPPAFREVLPTGG